jgi:hypothetical protein
VEDWLRNFSGKALAADVEQRHALHLLQQFIYFGHDEITECLRVLYRDHFVYPAVQELKQTLADPHLIATAIKERVEKETVFVGVGLPSESGTHMLYPFRTANDLSAGGALALTDIFRVDGQGQAVKRLPTINHLVFIDDLCGSGDQVVSHLSADVAFIRARFPEVKISFFVLFATTDGLNTARASGLFDAIEAAVVFDDDYKAFGPSSLSYRNDSAHVTLGEGKAVAEAYGKGLHPTWPLGHKGCELLLGFHHNTPDNTLPIFWCKDAPWYAIFPRTHKK